MMPDIVFVEVTFVGRCISTHITSKWFLPGVGSKMLSQTVSTFEFSPTYRAVVGSLIRAGSVDIVSEVDLMTGFTNYRTSLSNFSSRLEHLKQKEQHQFKQNHSL